ncbi:MAG TPA: tetratricopeptide repeat protein [Firmicutes bacterium]|nr:tetratricopeptide repeat protein [Bacillota bacterium]
MGYLYSEIVFDEEKMDLGLKYLDEGLKRHPARLDMHLGKLHALDKISRYEAGKEALLEMLNLSVELDNRWLYQDGVPLEDGYAFMLENIQGWINHYFNLEEERVHDYIIEICQRMIQLYPDCVYAYNNLGAICYYKNDYPEALAYFRQAAACNPEDTIVIKNIAHLARTIGDRELALEYYGKLMEYGNEEEKEMAAEQIKLLEEANE